MPLHVVQVACDLCSGVHTTEIALKLDDDGPQKRESVASFYAGKKIPPGLAVRNDTFRCPVTGGKFSPKSDEKVFVMPAPFRG